MHLRQVEAVCHTLAGIHPARTTQHPGNKEASLFHSKGWHKCAHWYLSLLCLYRDPTKAYGCTDRNAQYVDPLTETVG